MTKSATPMTDGNCGIVTNAIGEKLEAIPASIGREIECKLAEVRRELKIIIGQALDCAERELKLQQRLAEAEDLMRWFVKRVENGEVKSKQTYAKYKAFLDIALAAQKEKK